MCFDVKTSVTTFIIGTVFNIIGCIIYNFNPTFVSLAVLWQFVLLMQIADALAWLNTQCGSLTNKAATLLAYIANITQPLVVFLVFMLTTSVSFERKFSASVLIFVYLSYMLISSNTFTDTELCLTPTNNCNSLSYYWWTPTKGQLYFITIISIILLLLSPLSLSMGSCAYITFTLVISKLVYRCGVPSIWCWLAAFAPIFNIWMFRGYLIDNFQV
jgi:phage-related protein